MPRKIDSQAISEKIARSIQEFVACFRFDVSEDPFCVKDRHSRFLYANPAYKKLVGLDSSFDLEGLSESDFPSGFADCASEIKKQEQIAMSEKKGFSAIVTFPLDKTQRYTFSVPTESDYHTNFSASEIKKQVEIAVNENQSATFTYPVGEEKCQKYTFSITPFCIDDEVVGVHYWGKKSLFHVDPESKMVFFC